MDIIIIIIIIIIANVTKLLLQSKTKSNRHNTNISKVKFCPHADPPRL